MDIHEKYVYISIFLPMIHSVFISLDCTPIFIQGESIIKFNY